MDEKDFERVYRDYFDPVYRYALALTRDVHAAEELTQETFFKAMQGIDGFRAFLSEKRRKRPEALDDLPEQADDSEGPESLALDRDESRRLHRILHELPEPYKEVFSLRVFGQLSFRDIGELFGKTDNWACVVYHRARSKIQSKTEGSL